MIIGFAKIVGGVSRAAAHNWVILCESGHGMCFALVFLLCAGLIDGAAAWS